MDVDLRAMDARLREQVCPTCARFTADQRCSLPPTRECSLFKNLPKIVDVVRTTHSHDLDDYADTLRTNVCAVCRHEDDHGTCPLRNTADCALDGFLLLIVDAIEQELGRQARIGASRRPRA